MSRKNVEELEGCSFFLMLVYWLICGFLLYHFVLFKLPNEVRTLGSLVLGMVGSYALLCAQLLICLWLDSKSTTDSIREISGDRLVGPSDEERHESYMRGSYDGMSGHYGRHDNDGPDYDQGYNDGSRG